MSGKRAFEDKVAARSRVPLFIGLVGPSGSGKTYSALRLAEGIRRVNGGDAFVVDTEARRSTHYAEQFRFRHVDFGAPFGPLDYLAAAEHCARQGASVIVIDSMSHEHEGPGGVLEQHEAEQQRIAKAWETSMDKANFAAWMRPKADRRRMINTLLQLPCSVICCFRAKEKLRVVGGGAPKPMGWMAIAAEELIFEMSVNAMLLPGARGVPTWRSQDEGTAQQIKIPGWAQPFFRDGEPLDEATGEALARWAAGTEPASAKSILASLATCSTPAALGAIRQDTRAIWKTLTPTEQQSIKDAAGAAEARIAASEKAVDREAGELTAEEEARAAAEAGGA
jgi:energy-coupling factor transporter ATP-binding protein EcfA2